jgi:flagellar assembly protein FliH
MSNLIGGDRLSDISSLGTFAFGVHEPIFTPWSGLDRMTDEDDDEPLRSEQDLTDEAYKKGWEEGRRASELALEHEHAALRSLAASLEALRPQPSKALGAVLAETVERLVRQIAGEVAIDADLLVRRAQAAAALVSEELAPGRMRVNPEDVALLSGAGLPVDLIADPSIERGSLVLETAAGWIEDGPSVRLARLRAALDGLGSDA